jgi:hypothetical protein
MKMPIQFYLNIITIDHCPMEIMSPILITIQEALYLGVGANVVAASIARRNARSIARLAVVNKQLTNKII